MLDRKKALTRRITNLRKKLSWAHSEACTESWLRQKPLNPASLRQAVVDTETEVERLGLEELRPAVAKLWSTFNGIEQVLKEDENEWMFDDYESLGGGGAIIGAASRTGGGCYFSRALSTAPGESTGDPTQPVSKGWGVLDLIAHVIAAAEAHFARDGVWPSVEQLIEETGCSGMEAQAALNRLKGGKLPP